MDGPSPRFMESLPDGKVACSLCPHRCVIAPGRTGLCRVRANSAGRAALPAWGIISSAGIDPIEKKPLHHFMPGSQVFSVGFYGCNLRCPFCQNAGISQTGPGDGEFLEPSALVEAARRSGAPSLAFTYSEPLVHFEYLLQGAALARAAGLRVVLVTNGCINEEAARELLPLVDAANVDLKCWSEEAYRGILSGELATVTRFIELAAASTHVEATTLVVPGLDDWKPAIAGIASFLGGLSRDLPLHLSACHPAWKWHEPTTPPELLGELALIARRALDWVYIGNVGAAEEETRCPACGTVLVRRRGYSVQTPGIAGRSGEETGKAGPRHARCARCGAAVPILI